MRDPSIFTLEDVLRQLHKLNVSFTFLGSPTRSTYGFKSLRQIEPGGIYYLSSGRVDTAKLEDSIILYSGDDLCVGRNVTVKVANPQLVFYKLMAALVGADAPGQGIHPTAIVAETCDIDPSACIGPYCVLEDCVVKAGAVLHSHVVVMRGSTIEEDVTIESHSTIGATGVAWIWDSTARKRVIQPQTGYTRIGRGSFLGSDITIVRGSVNETTEIGDACVIAHGSKIGHGSRIGAECHFANNTSIAGNVTMGLRCFLGSGAVVRPQIRLADRTTVGAGAVVVSDSEEAGVLLVGVPAKPSIPKSDALTGVPRPLDH